MSKYEPLQRFLQNEGHDIIPMTFSEIEKLVAGSLPSSAFRHRPWWSNNPSNSVITRSWLKAGYKTEKVDMKGQRLVFRRNKSFASMQSQDVPAERPASESDEKRMTGKEYIASFYGSMKLVVQIVPGTDLTSPSAEKWKAEEGRL